MKKMKSKNSRRAFIKNTALASSAISVGLVGGVSAKSYSRILGANDRVTVAQIGCKRRAGAMKDAFKAINDKLNIKYVCDIYKPQMEKFGNEIKEETGQTPQHEGDIRKLLEDKEVDAIFNATPDHWHAPGTWLALEAGKHVYVEKPCSHNPWEGELLVEFQKKYGKVVQMGNQQRSAQETQEIIAEIHKGAIGEAYKAVAFYNNSRDSIGKAKAVSVPEGFDWELFQGPAPRAEYLDVYFDYNWHWFWPYGTGETGNNSVHEIDIARWALQLDFPDTVSVDAGKYHFKDDSWVMYDTMEARFEFGNKTIVWDGKCRNNYPTYGPGRGTIIYGSEGSVFVDRNGYKMYDRGGKLVKEADAAVKSSTTGLGGGGNATNVHVNNFIETIKGTTKQNSPIDEGAKSTLLGHLANIAYRADSVIKCDPKTGQLLDKKLMKTYWKRQYEPGWEPKL
ncbi:Gfo/Idh/MocA family oxidoreductase [Flexithrix dorotheae]|uniref:Gfo/Idh/MocA family protein n=1 Tax=Flexithrix dorotheae TaxID=70993 RepID=UPI00036E8866